MVIALGEAKIKTLEDFADLASDEIVGVDDGILREYKLEAKKANELILRARVIAGWISEEDMAIALAPVVAVTDINRSDSIEKIKMSVDSEKK